MVDLKTKIGPGGRIVVPVRYRKIMGVEVGDEVVLVLDGEGVRVMTPRQAVKRAQELVRKYVPGGRSLADELIEERRRESESG
jgi:bifunctional DNA-binding transcriptional regulator/antitoxin component of YhaV-PrlF toxin-antitoxin module